MIPYNVSESKLVLPEYGRNIQRMVDHCLTIEDKGERTVCAYSIADVMSRMFPDLLGEGGDRQKIWDHINIMSGFNLDIDFPCEVLGPEQLSPEKKSIPYSSHFYRYRLYGKNIQSMIKTVADMENCVEKDQLIFLIANQMKKILITNNQEGQIDARVFADIRDMSEGKIDIDPNSYKLNEYLGVMSPEQKSKKKKK